MKKIFTLFAIFALTAGTLLAQDMKKATELAQNANSELEAGNYENALTGFRSALEEAQKCGDEGQELVTTCQNVIPGIIYKIGNTFLDMKEFDLAIESFNEAVSEATKYENADMLEKATSRLSQVYMSKGVAAMNAKNYDEAIASFAKAVETSPTNGVAYLRMGQAYMKAGKFDEAETAFNNAVENGQEAQGTSMLKSLTLTKIQTAYQNKDYNTAVASAKTMIEKFGADPKAYQFAIYSTLAQNNMAEATKFYEDYQVAFPDAKDKGAYAFRIAVAYHKATNLEKAKEYYKLAVDDPKFGQTAKETLAELSK